MGSGTTVEYIQVHENADDGIEFFGGTVNAKYVVLTSNKDDSVDWTNTFIDEDIDLFNEIFVAKVRKATYRPSGEIEQACCLKSGRQHASASKLGKRGRPSGRPSRESVLSLT